MNFKELVMNADVKKTLEAIIRLYPDQADIIEAYAGPIEFLLNTEPAENTDGMSLLVEKEYEGCQFCRRVESQEDLAKCNTCSDKEGAQFYTVTGQDEEGRQYALDFTPWEEWLGYNIPDRILECLTKEEILAHALWEMTFISFDPAKIQERKEDLIKSIEELENGTAKTYSLEEVLGELGDSNGST